MSSEIETLIRGDRWLEARHAIRAALRLDPENHWLIGRLALTYYERREYTLALKHGERALKFAPSCPLLLWDHAGTLQMLGRHKEAMAIYSRVIRRGTIRIARGRCGEGVARARGLVADCHLRLSDSLQDLGRHAEAMVHFEKHLDMRGPGCHSIYPLAGLSKPRSRLTQHTRD